MAGSTPKSSKNPAQLQKSLSRRVSFNDVTQAEANAPKPYRNSRPPPSYTTDNSSDMEAQPTTSSRPKPKFSSRFNSGCAWASVIVGILLVIFFILGCIFFSFLQSNLPEVRLQRLDVNLLNVSHTNTETLLTTDFEVRLNVTNKNSRIEMSSGTMKAFLSSEGIDLGMVKVEALQQKPETSSEIRIRSQLKNMPVEEAAGKDLQDNSNIHKLVIDLEVKGHIDFLVNGHKMNGFPFKIVCHRIDQSEIDNGHAPRCNIRMRPFY